MGDDGGVVDFFVSHAGPDRGWAVWVDAQLRSAGFSTITDVYDFQVGSNFVLLMNDALERASRVVLLVSPQALDRWMVESEWTAAFTAGRDRLIPVVVEECELPEILRPILHVDLTVHGSDGDAAGADLVQRMQGVERPGTGDRVPFPAAAGGAPRAVGRFPVRDSLLFSSLIPPRDRFFTGRSEQLKLLDARLQMGESAALVQAVEGLGGVGKSALAVEHCYRSRGSVDVVWWVRGEEPDIAFGDLAALGDRLGVTSNTASLAERAAMVRDVLASLPQRWLLVIDNVEDPSVLDMIRPTSGLGQVLITARSLPSAVHVERVTVDVLDPADAVEFLHRRLPDYDPAALGGLAERLGRLALALEQAAAYLVDTGASIDEYLVMLAVEGLDAGDGVSPTRTVSSVFRGSIARAIEPDPNVGIVMEVVGFLSPELIPRALLSDPEQRNILGIDSISALNAAISMLARLALISATSEGYRAHRLVQEVTRHRAAEPADTITIATHLLIAATPDEIAPSHWTEWELLLPHQLVVLEHTEQHDCITRDTFRLESRCVAYLNARGNYISALTHSQRATTNAERTLGTDHPDTLQARQNLSIILGNVGRFEEALRVGEQVADDLVRVLGVDHPETLHARQNLAERLRRMGRYEEALRVAEQVAADTGRVLGVDHPDTLQAWNNLATMLATVGQFEEALTVAEKVATDYERVLGVHHPDALTCRLNLAISLASVGRLEEALLGTEQVATDCERVLGADHPHTLASRYNLSKRLAQASRFGEALTVAQQVVVDRERVLGVHHPDTVTSRGFVASLRERGDT